MKLSEIKNHLQSLEQIAFELPVGTLVPRHFHVTEVGKVIKHFVDCGGKERLEEKANFQLWEANDYDHRLHPEKLVHIIEKCESTLSMGDLDIEVEYQGATIGKYGLDFDGTNFLLTSKQTDCLAKSDCGIPSVKEKKRVSLASLNESACCTPESGCC